MQTGKQEVNEAVEGQECGINFIGKPLIEEGDILHIYQEETIVKKL